MNKQGELMENKNHQLFSFVGYITGLLNVCYNSMITIDLSCKSNKIDMYLEYEI